MENFNREEVKEEVLKLGKWKRFFFMVVYAFVLGFALNISIGIAFIQFLFYLFTSKINEALFNALERLRVDPHYIETIEKTIRIQKILC